MLKTAIVHDWLTGMRGGEHVLEAICSIFPESDIFTLFHLSGSVSKEIENHRIYTSFLQHMPGINRLHRYFLPLFPSAIESFNLSGYDLVISVSHCVAKGVITPVNSIHVSYILTPMRYAWDLSHEYFESGKITGTNNRIVAFFLNYLRMWDITSMARCDNIITISKFVARRLKKYFKMDATVIYPPVDTEFFVLGGKDEGYYLIVSALAPYKMIENAIYAFNKLKKRLVIVGTGQMEKKLKKISEKNIEFSGWLLREEVLKLMQNCTAFILPGVEDFGIAPVEAQACGKPVIAMGAGGTLETVVPFNGKDGFFTGVFFEKPTPDSLIDAIVRLEKVRDKFQPERIRIHALNFSKQIFVAKFKDYLNKVINDSHGTRIKHIETYA